MMQERLLEQYVSYSILVCVHVLAYPSVGSGLHTHDHSRLPCTFSTQNAIKLKPDILVRYRIFSALSKTKRLKDATDGALDLQSYVEFKRNYRMLVRVHKEALQTQRDFWKQFMHTKSQDATIRKSLKDLEHSSKRAQVGKHLRRGLLQESHTV
jgi:hypothetical protein